MNILITGGAGFIGSSLADKLLFSGNKIIVVDNFNGYYSPALKEKNIAHNIDNPHYKLYRHDVCDKDSVFAVFEENQVDCVVHIAASAGVRASIAEPEQFVRSNIAGTINILEAMKRHGVKKMVFASSSSVYGNCKAEKFSEDLKVTEPISPYAATKSACEQFLYTYSSLYGIQAICLRFFTVYGPRQRPDLAICKFIDLMDQGKPIPMYGDGSTIRDYTYIDDIVDGIIAAINYQDTPYEIINLGGGAPISLMDMIKTIEDSLNIRAEIQMLPNQPGDVDKTAADISKAQKLFGYSPKISFEEGIKRFVEWKNG